MSKVKRTPGPWTSLHRRVLAASDQKEMAACSALFVGHPEACANAAFIVLACNTHDRLLAAAQVVLDYVDTFHPPQTAREQTMQDELRAAIDAAEGGE